MGAGRPVEGALGANYNESLDWIDHGELNSVGAKWIRGFLVMHRVNVDALEDDPKVQAVLRARQAGFKMILSFKWAYKNRDLPRPESPEQATEVDRFKRVLEFMMDKVDIIVIGNEPFVDTKPDQAGEVINSFYESLAHGAFDVRKSLECSATLPRLYMGALNRLDLPARCTPAVQRMLEFIKSRPELDGVDLHPHMPRLAGHKAMLDYALPRIRADQTFLITEFSIIWHWKKHLRDVVSPYFREKYHLAEDCEVHEVITDAIRDPVSLEKWEDFLSHEPWYQERRNFIGNAMKLYTNTGRMDVATYSFCPMRHRTAPLGPTDNPWLLNSLLAPVTVQTDCSGQRHGNYPWAGQFRRFQSKCGDTAFASGKVGSNDTEGA